MKFRKKPVVIDAHQLPIPPIDGSTNDAYEDLGWKFMEFCSKVGFEDFTSERDGAIAIKTLEGTMEASPGDWIIKGVKGEFYPCKPDIFAATYEPADDHGTAGIVAPAPNRELSFGEKAVGLGFNPGANPEVHACKAGFAVEIDRMHNLRTKSDDADVWRMTEIAIEGLQTAQMWAVKAVTWKS